MARDKVPQLAYVSSMGESERAFARLIRDARKRRKWNQERLADESNLGRRTISRWENGDVTEPEAQQVIAVSDVLDIDRQEAFRALGWLHRVNDGDIRRPVDIRDLPDDELAEEVTRRLIERARREAEQPPETEQLDDDESDEAI